MTHETKELVRERARALRRMRGLAPAARDLGVARATLLMVLADEEVNPSTWALLAKSLGVEAKG